MKPSFWPAFIAGLFFTGGRETRETGADIRCGNRYVHGVAAGVLPGRRREPVVAIVCAPAPLAVCLHPCISVE